jgi:hypothetical protein
MKKPIMIVTFFVLGTVALLAVCNVQPKVF